MSFSLPGANRSFVQSRPVKRAAFFGRRRFLWERAGAGTGTTAEEFASGRQFERLLFDVRVGRLAQFVLLADSPLHVFVSSE